MPLRAFTEAETTLTERRRLERPLLVLLWLGIVLFCLAEGSTFYIAAATLAVLVNLLAAWRWQELYVHRLFVNLAVLLATGVLVWEVLTTRRAELLMISHYLILLQLCKLFEQKRNRDYVLLLVMSGLLVLSATLISDAVWLAAGLAVYVPLMLYAAMVFTLKRRLDAAASRRLVTETAPPAPTQVAWNVLRDWPERALQRAVWTCLAAMIVGGLVVFLAAPRELGGLGRFIEAAREARAEVGFTTTVELGKSSEIYTSDRIAMRVTVSRGGQPVMAGGSMAYLRGQTFDTYRRSQWVRSASGAPLVPADDVMGAGISDPRADAMVQEVSMVPTLLPAMFAAYPGVAVWAQQVSVSRDGQLNYVSRPHRQEEGPIHYTVWSWPAPLGPRQVAALAQVRGQPPPPPPPVATDRPDPVGDLARQWCSDLLDMPAGPDRDLAIAQRIRDRLRKEYRYTLDLRDADRSRDGVEDFLFHLRKGHCEYFASSFVVLCQRLGVTARLAAGFHLGSPDSPGTYTVRDMDAHAWGEVFTPRTDWVIFDATPGDAVPPTGGWARRVRSFWQTLQFYWYERVSGYDAASQRRLQERIWSWATDAARAIGNAVSSAAAAVRDGFVNLIYRGYVDETMLYLAIGLGVAALAAQAAVIRRARIRRRQAGWDPARLPVPIWQLAFVSRLFRLLQRHGLAAAPGQTALATVNRAAAELHLPADKLQWLVALYYRLRWGGQAADADELSAAEERVDEIQRLLAKE